MFYCTNTKILSIAFLFNVITIGICNPIPLPINNNDTDNIIKSDVNSSDLSGSESISISKTVQKSNNNVNEGADEHNLISSIIGGPVLTRESVHLETEDLNSKVLSIYDQGQQKLQEFFNPLPIVDTIEEHEKYGNSGDKFLPVGKLLVNSYEGLSNIVNKLINAPVEAAKSFSRGITDSLNNIGGKLVGLA